MKFLILSLCLMASLNSFAQKDSSNVKNKVILPLKDSVITYEEVMALDTTYKTNTLYKAAKTWFVNSFKNAKAVIQSDDPSNGRIIAKGVIQVPVSLYVGSYLGTDCEFTVQIDIKAGKYRYKIYNIYCPNTVMNTITPANVSQVYSKYLHNEYQAHGLLGINKMYGKFNETFKAIDANMVILATTLKMAMLGSKKDDF